MEGVSFFVPELSFPRSFRLFVVLNKKAKREKPLGGEAAKIPAVLESMYIDVSLPIE
jgi:hypothetical protein